MLFENVGYCPICQVPARFIAEQAWLRDHYLCIACRSIPRQRALVHLLYLLRPDWKKVEIHESSPSLWFFRDRCPNYSFSYYFEGVTPGASRNGVRCENLEQLTFPDGTFDLFITQDVLEHVFAPDRALAEISRVLRPGGMHIFTTPKYKDLLQSRQRARLESGQVIHVLEPVYHGNPISAEGSLVTWDYGADFIELAERWSGYQTSVYVLHDRHLGIDGEFMDVFVTVKNEVNSVTSLHNTSAIKGTSSNDTQL
jgi:SAM-dependent methyltransferase